MNLHFHGNHDDRTVNISPGQGFDWSFCKTGNQHYYGDFNWGSKSASLALFDKHIDGICFRFKIGTRHCYWLVRTEGFYVSRSNSTFPGSWRFQGSWN